MIQTVPVHGLTFKVSGYIFTNHKAHTKIRVIVKSTLQQVTGISTCKFVVFATLERRLKGFHIFVALSQGLSWKPKTSFSKFSHFWIYKRRAWKLIYKGNKAMILTISNLNSAQWYFNVNSCPGWIETVFDAAFEFLRWHDIVNFQFDMLIRSKSSIQPSAKHF